MNSPFSRMSTSKTKLAAGHFYSQRQWSFWWPFSDFLGSFKGNRLLKSWKHENISLGLEGYKEDTTAISRNRSPWSDGIPLRGLGFDNQVPWVGHDSVSQAFFVSLVKQTLPARWGSVLWGGGRTDVLEDMLGQLAGDRLRRPSSHTHRHVTPWLTRGVLA